jgi:aspartyl-tRNA(Asn)/glutamyl-tRNA(Gln) amidotransferase subunit C
MECLTQTVLAFGLFFVREDTPLANISKADVEYVAELAKLTLDDDAKERLVREMGEILSYMDQLSELDTTGIEPMMHVLDIINVFREDMVGQSLTNEQALANAPASHEGYFLVPRILEQE